MTNTEINFKSWTAMYIIINVPNGRVVCAHIKFKLCGGISTRNLVTCTDLPLSLLYKMLANTISIFNSSEMLWFLS
jgi:hypothetical protein